MTPNKSLQPTPPSRSSCKGGFWGGVAELSTLGSIRAMAINRYIVPFSWGWSGLSVASGVLVAFFSGWTLLHTYTPLFYLTIGVFGGSLLTVPALITLGLWEWRSGRASRREFLLHFLTPQLIVIAGFLIGYVTESIRTHAA